MPAKPIYVRTTIGTLPLASSALPAGLSGTATITGTMRDGQTITFAWPTVDSGRPSGSAVLEYTVLTTTNGGLTFATYSQSTSPPASAVLVTADVGKQFQLRARVRNAATYTDTIPQTLSALSAAVTAVAVVAPTFASGPTVTGTAANGQVMTVAFTTAGTAPITSEIRWLINTGVIVGQTASTWTGLGLTGGDQVKAQVRLTGPGGSTDWVDSNILLVATGGAIAQTATFGTVTPAGSGGWRPQLASGAVDALASYNSLTSGSLGAYVPSIASGRLVFTGGGAGAPNGAVLNCTGISGRVYAVTIATAAARKDIAQDSDISAAAGITANLGLTLVLRQNAQLPPRLSNWLSSGTQSVVRSGQANPITVIGEGFNGNKSNYIPGEYHYTRLEGIFADGTTFQNLVHVDDPQNHTGILYKSSSTWGSRNLTFRGLYGRKMYNVDNLDPLGPQADWGVGVNASGNATYGFGTTGYSKQSGIINAGFKSDRIRVYDCTFEGGYIPLQIHALSNWIIDGQRVYEPYYDFRRVLLGDGSIPVKFGIEGVNASFVLGNPSVNEIPETVRHLDVNQITDGGQYSFTMVSDPRLLYQPAKTPDISFQNEFLTYRPSTRIGGFALDYTSFVMVGRTNYGLNNSFPENCFIDRLMLIPGPEYVDKTPITTSGFSEGNNNMIILGQAPGGSDGGWIGNQTITNSFMRKAVKVMDPTKSGFVSETGSVYYDGHTDAQLAANIAAWPYTGIPDKPTAAEIFAMCGGQTGSALEAISPRNLVTIPDDSLPLSGYTISDTLRPVPVLSSLTVTDAASAAFTVTTNYAKISTLFWSVTSAALTGSTDAAKFEQIYRATNGNTAPFTLAAAFGVASKIGGAGVVSGGGSATLPSGTYYLNVAQLNGTKKLAVVSTSFVVP